MSHGAVACIVCGSGQGFDRAEKPRPLGDDARGVSWGTLDVTMMTSYPVALGFGCVATSGSLIR